MIYNCRIILSSYNLQVVTIRMQYIFNEFLNDQWHNESKDRVNMRQDSVVFQILY